MAKQRMCTPVFPRYVLSELVETEKMYVEDLGQIVEVALFSLLSPSPVLSFCPWLILGALVLLYALPVPSPSWTSWCAGVGTRVGIPAGAGSTHPNLPTGVHGYHGCSGGPRESSRPRQDCVWEYPANL